MLESLGSDSGVLEGGIGRFGGSGGIDRWRRVKMGRDICRVVGRLLGIEGFD